MQRVSAIVVFALIACLGAPVAVAAPLVSTGLAPFSSTSIAAKYRAFKTTTAKEVFVGFDALNALRTSGTYTSRLDQDLTWAASQTVTLTWDPAADALTSTVVVGGSTYTKTYTKVSVAAPSFASGGSLGQLHALEMTITAKDALASVGFANMTINGQSAGSFLVTNSVVPGAANMQSWTITGLDYGEGFTITGTLNLTGAFSFAAENSSLQFRFGDVPNPDSDGDGDLDSVDCAPYDALIFSGADETCDGVDEDCDGVIDNDPIDGLRFYRDEDGDGFGNMFDPILTCDPIGGLIEIGGDCDDTDILISPEEMEFCVDGQDNNCDGVTDGYCEELEINVPPLFTTKGRTWIDEDRSLLGTQIIVSPVQGYAGVADRIAFVTESYFYTTTGLTGAPLVVGRTSSSTNGVYEEALVGCGRPFVVGVATTGAAEVAWQPAWNSGLTKTMKMYDRATDSDGDGVPDVVEVMVNCTDPKDAASY